MSRRKSANPVSLFSFQDIITSVTGIMILVTLLMALELSQRVLDSPRVQTMAVNRQLEVAVSDAEENIRELESQLAAREAKLEQAAARDRQRMTSEAKDAQRQLEQLETETQRLAEQADAAKRRQRDMESRERLHQQEIDQLNELNRKIAELEEQLRKLKSSNRVIYNPAQGTSKEAWLVEVTGQSLQVAPMGRAAQPTVFSVASAAQVPPAFQQWLAGRDKRAEYFVLLIKASGVQLFDRLKEELTGQGFELGFDIVDEKVTVLDPQTGAGA